MTEAQILQLGLALMLGWATCMFLWGQLRYDLVAIVTLLGAVLMGAIPAKEAFSGFSDKAVMTVALVLIISKSLQQSGVIDAVGRALKSFAAQPLVFLGLISGLGAILSGFMNNVGALALLMPIALAVAALPARVLMPLSFATILGGMITLIGTPPNLVIASLWSDLLPQSDPLSMFDFAYVGGPVALIGLVFIVLIGWRFLPENRGAETATALFEKKDYLTEIAISEGSPALGQTMLALENASDGEVTIVSLQRGNQRHSFNIRSLNARADDMLFVRAGPLALEAWLKDTGLEIQGAEQFEDQLDQDHDLGVVEAVVQPGAWAEGRSAKDMRLRRRFSANMVGLARAGEMYVERVARTPLAVGDVVLLQGDRTALPDTLARLGLLPLADRDVTLETAKQPDYIPLIFFTAAIGATALGWMAVEIAFLACVAGIVISGRFDKNAMYEVIDWPIIVLLGCMLPMGTALEATGAAQTVAGTVASLAGGLDPIWVLALIFLLSMTLSDVMNNVATTTVMAPISVSVAQSLGAPPEPFLMAVAVSASCAFLTPIGHKNNLLVMGPGGYKFGDYWRLGLPLEILITIVAVPLIWWVWG